MNETAHVQETFANTKLGIEIGIVCDTGFNRRQVILYGIPIGHDPIDDSCTLQSKTKKFLIKGNSTQR